MQFNKIFSAKILIIIIILFSCGCSDSASNYRETKKIVFFDENYKEQKFDICADKQHNKYCLSNEQVLSTIYGSNTSFTQPNLVKINTKGEGRLIYSAAFENHNQLFALFVSGFSKYDNSSSIETCHSCVQQMGIAIYAFDSTKHKWEFFSINPNVGTYGSYGEINLGVDKNTNLSIYPGLNQDYLLTLEMGFTAQGYTSTSISTISVIQALGDKATKDLGTIDTSLINCSGIQNSALDWDSKQFVIFSKENIYPEIHLDIEYKSEPCESEKAKVLRTEKQIYKYSPDQNKYLK